MVYKDGLRYRAGTVSKGYNVNKDISEKIGTNVVRSVSFRIDRKFGAGTPLPLKAPFQKFNFVKLNNCKLAPATDFQIEGGNIVFTFNLSTNDLIEIEGIV